MTGSRFRSDDEPALEPASGHRLDPERCPALSAAQLQRIDRLALEDYGLVGVVLMENAGHGAARLLHDSLTARGLTPVARIAIVCGRGNNGGDGLVVARWLESWGYSIQVLLTHPADQLSSDAAANLRPLVAAGSHVTVLDTTAIDRWTEALSGATVIVDALLGTGTRGALRTGTVVVAAIEALNHSRAFVVSLDVPSGLDPDSTSAPALAVRAAWTITFAASKLAFRVAQDWVGQLSLVEIGVPRSLLDQVRLDGPDH